MNAAFPPMSTRDARRSLCRIEDRLAAAERLRENAARDVAVLTSAAKCAFVALAERESEIPGAADPVAFMAVADRHAAKRRFVRWRPTSTDPIAIAREAEEALATALDEAEVALIIARNRAEDAQADFAVAARDAVQGHPGLPALYVGEFSAAGLLAANDDPLQFIQRFRGWLVGRGVGKVEKRA